MADKKAAGEVFAKKFNASRSAIRALWPEAEEGTHYKLVREGTGWSWKPTGNAARRVLRERRQRAQEAARAEAAKARAEERERKAAERATAKAAEKAAKLAAKNKADAEAWAARKAERYRRRLLKAVESRFVGGSTVHKIAGMISRPEGACERELSEATGYTQLRVLVREVALQLPGTLVVTPKGMAATEHYTMGDS